MISRRNLLKALILSKATGIPEVYSLPTAIRTKPINTNNKKRIMIQSVDSNFEREPLVRPFGFKGGYMTEIWQVASCLQSSSGIKKVGLCSQGVLWSDASVYSSNSESGGNALMYALTGFALRLIKGREYDDHIGLLDQILQEVYQYGKKITGNPNLRETFILMRWYPLIMLSGCFMRLKTE